MLVSERCGVLLLMLLLCASPIVAQDGKPPTALENRAIHLAVVVTDKSGTPVRGLQLEDFTVLDNGAPQGITSFEAVDGQQAHVQVVVVIDAVTVGARELAIEREEIQRFLKADEGHLAFATTFAVLTEAGIQLHLGFSEDGNALSSALGHQQIPRRSIGRDTDRGGSSARFDSAFQGFAQLLEEERERPGRKLIIWVSPNWPMLPQARSQQILPSIVEIATELREGQITLYMVDPAGTADLTMGLEDTPVNHTRPADSETPSGGLVLHPGNDMAAALRRCVSDGSAYYEISFNRAIADRPDEYHRLEIRVGRPGLAARTTEGYYAQPPRAESLTAGSEQPRKVGDENTSPGAALTEADNAVYANAHPYLDWPVAQLTGLIPELKAMQPAADQQQLPIILENTGHTVDDFVRNIRDLIAREDVTQEKLNAKGRVEAKERVRDNYLILHHGREWGASAEYRMDDKGNRLGQIGLEKGYLVTLGYALSCIRFSTVAQRQSKFRYLGEEKLGSRETYVVGYAQVPAEATFTSAMGIGGREVDMLEQGILWVDKNNFQIVRTRSDLLAPHAEIGLDQLTTEVTFGEVRLQDVPKPLWLPSDVTVYLEISGEKFQNIHHYTNYRRYRVSVKIGASP